jgi:fructose-1,6-bisphosphatase/sedoheptulose 1,7-bisphosphatase-like protein
VSAALDDGTAVEITTDSDVAAAFADAMHPGERVHITGAGQVSDGVLLVKLRLAVPIGGK